MTIGVISRPTKALESWWSIFPLRKTLVEALSTALKSPANHFITMMYLSSFLDMRFRFLCALMHKKLILSTHSIPVIRNHCRPSSQLMTTLRTAASCTTTTTHSLRWNVLRPEHQTWLESPLCVYYTIVARTAFPTNLNPSSSLLCLLSKRFCSARFWEGDGGTGLLIMPH